ncbi:MAG: SDR family NAD(P)-dependent oxidoreductase [Bacteroidetes bacterium]|jgi:3-hydroxy acid dehydrogenase / malonic semialdehyde reductase|nr:SDR family NAD(P)-dependent oxidoreductase [Bacteroidota bacterium]MBT6684705.1 SDR family NAD(P)-dependent oxidoreductase [Bacteroidota bacterium]MBT7143170.1 SDR family NAD(P)-dependent oxidoreductase [Bacteroidota bacterium]MBT7492613.1 SDR family NAD(P)-dependent oxidoreductase [Bacteroidota bacterium]
MKKIALITGATSGIGKATAYKLAENQFNIIITGRRKERLTDLKQEIVKKFAVEVLCLSFDIRQLEEVNQAIESLPDNWKKIDILVNNAGLAVGLSPIHSGLIDDWERMIDTNIKGLLYITRKISPIMAGQKTGHIINIGSIAAKETYANGNAYCATKHAVDSLSKAMRIDLLEYGIKVTAIHPGMVDTEFSLVRFKGDKQAANKVYDGMTPLFANDIAEAILFAVSRPAHVNINDMLIMPTCQASSNHLVRNS